MAPNDRLERLRRMYEEQLKRPLTPDELKLLALTIPFENPENRVVVMPRASGQ